MQSANTLAREREFDFDDIHFRFLSGLSHARTGIVLAEQKRDMVYGRLVRRLRALNLESFAAYCDLLTSPQGEEEIEHLVNALTTNLTSFFREWHHFEHLRDVVLPSLTGPRIRLWSAACSSGMEPYSMAMVMHEALAMDRLDARILATDIDSNMLQTGSAGEYDHADVKNFPAEYSHYIKPATTAGRVQMDPALRDTVSFRQLNLLEDWPMKGPFDAIFCRNVVIYFDKPTKEKLFDRMAEMLVLGGYLYIGHSENLNGVSDRFELVGRTTYRRIA